MKYSTFVLWLGISALHLANGWWITAALSIAVIMFCAALALGSWYKAKNKGGI